MEDDPKGTNLLLGALVTLGGATLGGFSGLVFACLYLMATSKPSGGSFAPMADAFYFAISAAVIGTIVGGMLGSYVWKAGLNTPDED